MPPSIRYPLPTAIVLILVALMVWQGEALTRPLRSALRERWQRVVEGPPVPSSASPQIVAGPIVRRGLLLRGNVPVTDHPEGKVIETLRIRMFLDIYDLWPVPEPGAAASPTTHYRVGHRQPMGWIQADMLLPWDTRLVVRPSRDTLTLDGTAVAVSTIPLPVLDWTGDAVRVAVWRPEQPWSAIDRDGWVPLSEIHPGDWAVWLSREEVLMLLRRMMAQDDSDPARQDALRLRAILGRLADDRLIDAEDVAAARPALPPISFTESPYTYPERHDRLAERNARWLPDASWAGLSFQAVPLDLLP